MDKNKVDDICIWITKINNCNTSNEIKPIAIIGFIITIITTCICLLTILRNLWNKKYKGIFFIGYDGGIRLYYYDALNIIIFICNFTRVIYLSLLITNKGPIWLKTLFQDILWIFVLNGCNMIFITILYIFPFEENIFIPNVKIRNILLFIPFIWHIFTIILEILSGLELNNYNFKNASLYTGIQFISWSFDFLIITITYFYYSKKYFDYTSKTYNYKSIYILNSIKIIIYTVIMFFGLFVPLWIIQGVFIIKDFINYNENIYFIKFICVFWYFLGFTPATIIFIYYSNKIQYMQFDFYDNTLKENTEYI